MCTGSRSRRGNRDGPHGLENQPPYLPLLRDVLPDGFRPERGALWRVRRRPRWLPPRPAAPNLHPPQPSGPARLRVRPPGDAPPARGRLPLPSLRLGGPPRLRRERLLDRTGPVRGLPPGLAGRPLRRPGTPDKEPAPRPLGGQRPPGFLPRTPRRSGGQDRQEPPHGSVVGGPLRGPRDQLSAFSGQPPAWGPSPTRAEG